MYVLRNTNAWLLKAVVAYNYVIFVLKLFDIIKIISFLLILYLVEVFIKKKQNRSNEKN